MRRIIWAGLAAAGVLTLSAGIFFLYQQNRQKNLQRVSYTEWEIRRLLQAGDYQKARDLIQKTKDNAGPLRPLLLSYLLKMQDTNEEGILKDILESTKDRDLSALYRERLAFYYYTKGQYNKALQELTSITEENFNYPSAQILKAQVQMALGNKSEATKILNTIAEKYRGTYWENLSRLILSEVI
ncbi:hypothetical protein Thal_0051 [Thermocrinis albus DSM 14484]|uniref:Tetratricopeptide repeat protein n=1 Tax=Thermocrinis albus (strain DSM 14484 / JCM 11386 / HI 11/12) TaxID=638303 RepID=D3SNF2_THEAH|nr:tetratricopeptide repeat protein [Thermocrinis albus]ADC88689.1 hypothetical protein Thal_0051 [Thermocrinis albus DSM 14484]